MRTTISKCNEKTAETFTPMISFFETKRRQTLEAVTAAVM